MSLVDRDLQLVQLFNVRRLDEACSEALRKCERATRNELEALDILFDNPVSINSVISKPAPISYSCCIIM